MNKKFEVIREATHEAPREQELLGYPLEWDPEKIVKSIRVHPEADCAFYDTVTATVAHYAPALKNSIAWSAMREPPPF